MANSFVSVRAAEGQTTFPFNFPNGYLQEADIHTYVDGVEVSRTISGGTAIIDPVHSGQEVIVARHSPQTPYISFEDGSILNKQNIDVQNRHAFMLAEEAAEQRDFFALGDIDMNYHKIIHVSPGEDQYDVVNKGQFDYFLQINEDVAQRAEDAADAAAVSAQQSASSASAALASQNAAAASAAAADASADSAANTVAGFDAHAEAKKADVTAEGNTQVSRVVAEGNTQISRVIAEGDIQYGRAKTEADRAQTYAEILERPYEDMGAHQIQQGYPPVPSFSSMWAIIDGGPDPIDGVTIWNPGDILLYSVQATMWSRLSGSILGGGGDPLPVEILDDLIMQQGKKIRFRIDEFTDTVGMTLDSAGDVVVGEIPSTPSTGTPAPKIGFAATELYHVTGTDAAGAAVKTRMLTESTGVRKGGDAMTGMLQLHGISSQLRIYDTDQPRTFDLEVNAGSLNIVDVDNTFVAFGIDSGKVFANKPVLSYAAQSDDSNALTRKDYVDTKAPGGYGLGWYSSAGHPRDFNQLMMNGWYEFNGDAGDTGIPSQYGNILTLTSGNSPGFPGWASQVAINTSAQMFIRSSAVAGSMGGAIWNRVFTTGSPPTAGEVGALPITGGTLSGGLQVNGNALSLGNNGSTVAFEVGADTNPYISVDFSYAAMTFTKYDRGAIVHGPLTAAGVMYAPDFYVQSDYRLKSDFSPLTGALAKVCSLNGMTYDKAGKREAGLIAQDVAEVLPEAVMVDKAGYLSIATAGVVALLVEAVKELREEVEELRNGRT